MRKWHAKSVMDRATRDQSFRTADALLVIAYRDTSDGDGKIHALYTDSGHERKIVKLVHDELAKTYEHWLPSPGSLVGWGVLGGLVLGRCLQMLGLV